MELLSIAEWSVELVLASRRFERLHSRSSPSFLERRERSSGTNVQLFLILSRRHVKEGNVITYIGAGVNILLSGLKVFVFL